MILINGAGDIATGIATRLYRSGYHIVMSDLPEPTAIRRTVSFCEAIRLGSITIEDIHAVRCENITDTDSVLSCKKIPVISNDHSFLSYYFKEAAALVDARLLKIEPDTKISDEKAVIGIGPGFTAGVNCHAVVETQRGHYLGRVYYTGSAAPNTGMPGIIGGYGEERVLRAPCDGVIYHKKQIGDTVEKGDTVALIDGIPMLSRIPGMIRGLLPDGIRVSKGMKSGDVDPRNCLDFCSYASDKALAVAGGVLEALLHFGVMPDK